MNWHEGIGQERIKREQEGSSKDIKRKREVWTEGRSGKCAEERVVNGENVSLYNYI